MTGSQIKLWNIYPFAKYWGSQNFEIGSRRPGHAHLEANLWFMGSNCPRSTCLPNLKSVTLTVCEILTVLRNFEIGSRHPRHTHLRGSLQSVNKNYLQSVSVRNLKSVALSATKIWHIFILRTNWPRDLDLWPFDLESDVRVTRDVGTSVPILVFLGLSVLDLGSMYATDVRRQTDVRQNHRLMPPPIRGGHNSGAKHRIFAHFWIQKFAVVPTFA